MKVTEKGAEDESSSNEKKQAPQQQKKEQEYNLSVSNEDIKALRALLEAQAQKIESLEGKLQEKTSPTTSSSDLAKLTDAILGKKKEDDVNYETGIDESKIPLDDIITNPADMVTFFVPSAGYIIVDDLRHGIPVKLPFGKKFIAFTHLNTGRAEKGKHTVLTPIASYVSRSKKEIEWLRKHTFYGSFIFEKTEGLTNNTAVRALRLSNVFNAIKLKEFPDIIKEAKDMGIPPTNSHDEMALRIATAIVDREEKEGEVSSAMRAKANFEDAMSIGREDMFGKA